MRAKLLIVLAFAFLTACQAAPASLSFTIKEFKLTRDYLEYSKLQSFAGRGLVTVAEPYFQSHNALLVLRYKAKYRTGEIREGIASVVLEKGSGELTTYDSFNSEKDDPTEPLYTWTAVGYGELMPAQSLGNPSP